MRKEASWQGCNSFARIDGPVATGEDGASGFAGLRRTPERARGALHLSAWFAPQAQGALSSLGPGPASGPVGALSWRLGPFCSSTDRVLAPPQIPAPRAPRHRFPVAPQPDFRGVRQISLGSGAGPGEFRERRMGVRAGRSNGNATSHSGVGTGSPPPPRPNPDAQVFRETEERQWTGGKDQLRVPAGTRGPREAPRQNEVGPRNWWPLQGGQSCPVVQGPKITESVGSTDSSGNPLARLAVAVG